MNCLESQCFHRAKLHSCKEIFLTCLGILKMATSSFSFPQARSYLWNFIRCLESLRRHTAPKRSCTHRLGGLLLVVVLVFCLVKISWNGRRLISSLQEGFKREIQLDYLMNSLFDIIGFQTIFSASLSPLFRYQVPVLICHQPHLISLLLW
jgi:hypothetical protein